MTQPEQSAVWSRHSSQWRKVGAPLRPSAEDGALMMAAVAPALGRHSDALEVVVLGVTPELVQLPWPAHTRLHAFDHSAEMIATVWQPHPRVPSAAQQASWQRLPLPDGSVDAFVGDGSLNALPTTGDYPEVLAELVRLLRPGGSLCLRCFIRPDARESLDAVAAAVAAGEVRSFHALKWRVAMALSEAPSFSVAVADIHAAFESAFPDRGRLSETTGWPAEAIATIDAYKGTQTRYTFPTMAALKAVCAPYFEVQEVLRGGYELAERCPTVRFARTPGTGGR